MLRFIPQGKIIRTYEASQGKTKQALIKIKLQYVNAILEYNQIEKETSIDQKKTPICEINFIAFTKLYIICKSRL